MKKKFYQRIFHDFGRFKKTVPYYEVVFYHVAD